MRIKKTILVIPQPKGRPRAALKGGRAFVYTPSRTLLAENRIRVAMSSAKPFPAGAPLRVFAVFYRPKPKSAKKSQLLPVSAPDIVNYASTVCDALEKYLWDNDSQITTIIALKRFGEPPRIELIVEDDDVRQTISVSMP